MSNDSTTYYYTHTVTLPTIEWINVTFTIDKFIDPTLLGYMYNSSAGYRVLFDPNSGKKGSTIISGREENRYDTIESAFGNFVNWRYETT